MFSFSADEPLDKILSGFKKYLEELPQEKVYLHFDRPYYSVGEKIWFKAYLVAGAQHEPSPFSRTLYVDLLTEDKRLVKQLKLFVEGGSVNGSFVLGDSLTSGNYLIQGYTQWMKNFDSDYFFHRQIKIWNTDELRGEEVADAKKVDVQFFAEGGEWVSGFRSKIAFKAIGEDGLARKIKGKIVDSEGQWVTNFESNVLGMGSASIVPLKGKTYKAQIDDPAMEIPLPGVKESGVALSVTNVATQDEIVVRIQSTELNKTVLVVAQTRGIICYASKIKVPNTLSFVKMPKKNFPTGVVQITVLEENGMPLCERLTFIDHHQGLTVRIQPNKQTFKPREKVDLSIDVKDAEGNPVMTDLSLAVCDDQQILVDDRRETIYSYLYFSSELRGHIESPGYYFDEKNTDRIEAMDALLLTQGWRRFLIDKALSGQITKPALQLERGLSVSGKLLDKFNSKPIADGKVTYFNMYPIPQVQIAKTSADGRFRFDELIYFDSAKTLLQGENKRGQKLIKFAIDSVPPVLSPNFPMYHLSGSLNDFEKQYFKERSEQKKIDAAYDFKEKNTMLDVVEIKDQRLAPITTRTKMYGNGSKTITVAGNDALENLIHPLQLIQGKVAGVIVKGSGIDWEVHIRGPRSLSGSGPNAMILVNNMQVDISTLLSLPVKNIESVDVFKGPDAAIFGAQGMYGVVAFYTKEGKDVFPPREGVYSLFQSGYQIPQQFYAPQYDVQKPEHVKPDRRITLLWAPLIVTDSTGHASISFYNHDLETTVTGIVEGLSIHGTPGTSQFKYSIKN